MYKSNFKKGQGIYFTKQASSLKCSQFIGDNGLPVTSLEWKNYQVSERQNYCLTAWLWTLGLILCPSASQKAAASGRLCDRVWGCGNSTPLKIWTSLITFQRKISFEDYFWLWQLGCFTCAKIRMPLVGLNAFSLLKILPFISFWYHFFICRACLIPRCAGIFPLKK